MKIASVQNGLVSKNRQPHADERTCDVAVSLICVKRKSENSLRKIWRSIVASADEKEAGRVHPLKSRRAGA
jgi:CRISPR/Cas system type I-B associated protein Csh2 (Cas7 group RAMP superfamily)